MEFKALSLSAAVLLASCVLTLATVTPVAGAAPNVKVTDGWVRAPAPGQNTASAYVELTSDSDAALVAAGSPAAASVELHSMSMHDGIMRMRAMPRIELPAGKTVKFAPGGLHLMLVDLKQPLKAGDTVTLHLSVQETGPAKGMSLTTLEVRVPVRATAAAGHRH